MIKSNPRRIAYEILTQIEKEKCHADALIDRNLSDERLRGPDRGLLRELVLGVLRRRLSRDHIIDHFSRQKTGRLEKNVSNLMRLGLYQIFFLDRIPVSAAVNETVELAKIFAPRASGLVNAVLRRADREKVSSERGGRAPPARPPSDGRGIRRGSATPARRARRTPMETPSVLLRRPWPPLPPGISASPLAETPHRRSTPIARMDDARVRQVSWLAALAPCPAFPVSQWPLGRGSPLTVAGAAAD